MKPLEKEIARITKDLRSPELAEGVRRVQQSAQNLQQSRNNLIDFNRTISDYFFNLQQKIKEAQIETDRLVKQIFHQDIILNPVDRSYVKLAIF